MKIIVFITLLLISFSFTSCGSNEQTNLSFKGITAATIYESLKSRGFSVDKQFGSDAFYVNCSRADANTSEEVRIYGFSPSELNEIKATFTKYNGKNIDEEASFLLGFISTIPYEGSQPDSAKNWVIQNISKNGSTTQIGVATIEVYAKEKTRTIRISIKQ